MRRLAYLAAATLTLGAAAGAQELVTGPPSADVAIVLGRYGPPADAGSVGQSFVAPAGADRLDRFQFYGRQGESFPAVTHRGYVAAFDPGTRTLVGPVLFESAPRTGTSVSQPPALETFETGGLALLPGRLALLPGRTYLAFLSAPEFFAATAGVPELRAYGGVPQVFARREGG